MTKVTLQYNMGNYGFFNKLSQLDIHMEKPYYDLCLISY